MKRIRLQLALFLAVALAAAGGCAHSLPYGAVGFRVDSNVPDATIWVDDVLIGKAADWAKDGLHIRAGFHRIEVRHPGYYSFFQEIELPEGSQTLVRADLRQLLE
jgi:PEGA domain